MPSLIPIVCHRCGQRGKVASVPSDLVCATCKTGEHLDLDDREAVLDPSDPMPLLPAGVPDQDAPADEVDPERRKKVAPVPGSPPYTQDALATPINASRKQAVEQTQWYVARSAPETPRGFVDVAGPFASEAEARAAKPEGEGYVVWADRSPQDQVAYERFMTSSRRTAKVWAGMPSVGDYVWQGGWHLLDHIEHKEQPPNGRDPWTIGWDGHIYSHPAADRLWLSDSPDAPAPTGSPLTAVKVAQIQAAVLRTNPGMSIKTARRVAEQTVARYPAVVKTAWSKGDKVMAWGNEPATYEQESSLNRFGTDMHVVRYDRTGEMVEVPAGDLTKAAGRKQAAAIEKLREAAEATGKEYTLIDGHRVDFYTAGQFLRMYDMLSPDQKAKADEWSMDRWLVFWSKIQDKVTWTIGSVRQAARATIARTFYDRDGNASDVFVPGAPLDYSTEGTTPTPAGSLQVGQTIRSFDGMSSVKTITSIEGADPFFPPDRYLVAFDDGSRSTLHKSQPLYVEGSRRTAKMKPGDKSPGSRMYGEGAHYSGYSSIDQAIDVARQNIPIMKRVVREDAWDAYLVLDKGDQGVYSVYSESAWTPQSSSMLPYEGPPPGTIVARVEPDGTVTRL